MKAIAWVVEAINDDGSWSPLRVEMTRREARMVARDWRQGAGYTTRVRKYVRVEKSK